MTCTACTTRLHALQAIINHLDEYFDSPEDLDGYPPSTEPLRSARRIATEAMLDDAPEDDDIEPMGRVELYTADRTLLGIGYWRYTHSMDTIDCEPFTVLEDGIAERLQVYMPNGTFNGEVSVGLKGSGAKVEFPDTQLQKGGVVSFPRMTMRHIQTCPHCGKVLNEAPQT